ncbi:MAG: MATE family efflux transporter [Lachnospiraceae bacterium]|nr:MATE family efflux transporter [Lachnospiraceae bacterium]
MTIKQFFGPCDMTTGKPWEKILTFTAPMIIGNIAQQLYSTVDSVIVGQYVGDNAIAAVGASGPILNLLLVLFMGISVGAGVMVSQYFGAKDREELSRTIGNCISLNAIASIIIMVLGALLAKPLLVLLDTPESILDWSTSYLVILCIGIAGSSYYNILCGVLRGLGDSISALVYLLVATVLNIVLDLLFVAQFNMGVAGVAWATIIAQAISAILCVFKLRRMSDIFDFKLRYMKISAVHTGHIIRLGIPSGLTQAIFSMAMIVVQSLTNSFGETLIAASVIIMRVDGFAMMPNFSFGNAMTTYAGQNVGARKFDRLEQGSKQGTLLAVGTATAITGIILLFGKFLMGIFTDTKELVNLSYEMMCLVAVGYIAVAVTQSLSGVMRGAGDTTTPMWISMITTIAIRIPVAYGIAYLTRSPENPNGSYYCLYISLLVSWVMGALITAFFYFKGNWKKKALIVGGEDIILADALDD